MLDNKGRLVIPTRYRPLLAAECEGKLTLTLSPERYVLIYPRPAWEAFRGRLLELTGQDGRDAQRLFLGRATAVEMDGAGRVLVSPELCKAARLERDSQVMLLGVGTCFELWPVERHEVKEDESTTGGALKATLSGIKY